jgi:dTMP kinase
LIAMDQRASEGDIERIGLQPREAAGHRGKFITFEGGEGTGKSTQAAMLAMRLESLGIAVLLTREPGGSQGAEIIRHVLLSGAAKPFGPEAEAILFAAARDDHVRCTIEPALAAAKWVICDRFADSTRVYQGVLGEVDDRLINALDRASIGDLKPDLTFVLDVPVELGLERAALRRNGSRPDRFEAEDVESHEKLRDAFLALAEAEPNRCVIVDASVSKDAVARQVWAVVDSRFEPALAPLTAEKLVS